MLEGLGLPATQVRAQRRAIATGGAAAGAAAPGPALGGRAEAKLLQGGDGARLHPAGVEGRGERCCGGRGCTCAEAQPV